MMKLNTNRIVRKLPSCNSLYSRLLFSKDKYSFPIHQVHKRLLHTPQNDHCASDISELLTGRGEIEFYKWEPFIKEENRNFMEKQKKLRQMQTLLIQEHHVLETNFDIPSVEETDESPTFWVENGNVYFCTGERVFKHSIDPSYGDDQVVGIALSVSKRFAALSLRSMPADEFTTVMVFDFYSSILDKPMCITRVHTLCWFHETLYFTKMNDLQRPFQVCSLQCSSIDSMEKSPSLVFCESDPTFCVDVSVSKNGKYIFVNSNSKTSSEVRYKLCGDSKLFLIEKRRENIQYFVEHTGERFWIVSNFGEKNGDYRIWSAPEKSPSIESWILVVEKQDENETCVEEMDVFHDRIVSFERSKRDGLQIAKILDLEGKLRKEINNETPWFQPTINSSFFQNSTFISGGIPVCTKKRLLGHPVKSLLKSDQMNIEQKRILVGPDNVPVTLSYNKQLLKNDGCNPLIVEAYGAYGISIVPFLDAALTSLIERGWIVAHAHIRGGAEKGRVWHCGGKLLNKKNGAHDLATCVHFLHAHGWGKPALTAGCSFSAGAVPFAILANEQPDLFKAMILQVPFLAVLDTMLDSTLPLTVTEYQEWGNPDTPAVKTCMEYYDPLHNLSMVTGPNMWITCALADKRVPFWTVCEYVKRLRHFRATNKQEKEIILQFCTSHFDTMGMDEKALQHAWLHSVLKL